MCLFFLRVIFFKCGHLILFILPEKDALPFFWKGNNIQTSACNNDPHKIIKIWIIFCYFFSNFTMIVLMSRPRSQSRTQYHLHLLCGPSHHKSMHKIQNALCWTSKGLNTKSLQWNRNQKSSINLFLTKSLLSCLNRPVNQDAAVAHPWNKMLPFFDVLSLFIVTEYFRCITEDKKLF